MDTNLNNAPDEKDVLIYFVHGIPPTVAGRFDGVWRSAETPNKVIPKHLIKGWTRIPFYPG